MARLAPPPPVRPRITDPLAVIPAKPANVELRRDRQGLIHLRRHPELTGLRRKIADLLGQDYTRTVALDQYGTLYYSLVDGAAPLHQIVDQMTLSLGQSRRAVADSVVLFTRKLMTLNLLELIVPAGGTDDRPQ